MGFTVVTRKWQNAKHSSRNAWVQVLKDLMRNAIADIDVDLEAETEQLGGSQDDGNSSSEDDPIPENFFGVKDKPPLHHYSSSSSSIGDNRDDVPPHRVRV